MRLAYTLLLYLLTPVVLARLWWRGRRSPEYRRRWGERFGFIAATQVPIKAGGIWIHAVSVGETIAAQPLLQVLRNRHPDTPIIFTTTTPTGSERARALFGDDILHSYIPYDLPGAVKRFLHRTQPSLLIVMETELWPNLYHACRQHGIKLVIANARLSERSAQRYRKLGALLRDTLQQVDLIAAQGGTDAERFLQLQAPADRVHVTGSLKFDLKLPAGIRTQGEALRRELGPERPVWIAASTHEGEEQQVLQAFRGLLNSLPDSLLILAPRHPERFDQVAELCAREQLSVVRRSQAHTCGRDTQVFLGDTMGELLLLYAASDVAFVGGSLVETGGHNLLEPAALGLPVVFGPHMFNFREISQLLLAQNAAAQVPDADALAAVVERWLRNGNLRHEVGQRGQQTVDDNKGALDRLLEKLETV